MVCAPEPSGAASAGAASMLGDASLPSAEASIGASGSGDGEHAIDPWKRTSTNARCLFMPRGLPRARDAISDGTAYQISGWLELSPASARVRRAVLVPTHDDRLPSSLI